MKNLFKMPFKDSQPYFEPLLAAAIAGITSHKLDGGLAKPLLLAFIGGAVGWLGKLAISSLFYYLKKKLSKNADKK